MYKKTELCNVRSHFTDQTADTVDMFSVIKAGGNTGGIYYDHTAASG